MSEYLNNPPIEAVSEYDDSDEVESEESDQKTPPASDQNASVESAESGVLSEEEQAQQQALAEEEHAQRQALFQAQEAERARLNALAEEEQARLKAKAEEERLRKEALAEAERVRRDAMLGQVVARSYTVSRYIGEGEASNVFLATMFFTEEAFALKVLKNPTDQRKDMFRAAARQMENLEHQNIVKTLFSIETAAGDPCCLQEYIKGSAVGEVLKALHKIQSERVIILILLQIAAALEHAHANSVLHGHLTDRDVMTIETGDVIVAKLTDLGMSGLRDNSINSPDWPYLSPLRLKGGPPTELCDIYALGVLGYKMASGCFPFNENVVREDIDEEPLSLRAVRPDLKCGTELHNLLRKATSRNPAKRLESAQIFKERLLEIVEVFEGRRSSASKKVYDKLPDMPFLAVLDERKKAQQEENADPDEKKKRHRKSKRQPITQTFNNLVALKHNMFDREQALAVKLASAAAQGSQRRSPVSTVGRMVWSVIICGGIFTAAMTYTFTHTKQLGDIYTAASIRLAMMFPKKVDPPPAPPPVESPKVEISAEKRVPTAPRPGTAAPSQPPPQASTSPVPGAVPGQQPQSSTDPSTPDPSQVSTSSDPSVPGQPQPQSSTGPIIPGPSPVSTTPVPSVPSQPSPQYSAPQYSTAPTNAGSSSRYSSDDKKRQMYKMWADRQKNR